MKSFEGYNQVIVDRLDEERKESVYQEARELIRKGDEVSMFKAVNLFASIAQYKDSMELVSSCNETAKRLKSEREDNEKKYNAYINKYPILKNKDGIENELMQDRLTVKYSGGFNALCGFLAVGTFIFLAFFLLGIGVYAVDLIWCGVLGLLVTIPLLIYFLRKKLEDDKNNKELKKRINKNERLLKEISEIPPFKE